MGVPKLTQLVNGRARIQVQVAQTPQPEALSTWQAASQHEAAH